MAGHSRPKDGVASLAYVPAIHVLLPLSRTLESKTWMPGIKPGLTAGLSLAPLSLRPAGTRDQLLSMLT